MRILEYVKYKMNKKNYVLKRDALRFRWLKKYQFQTILDVGSNVGQFAEKIILNFPKAEIHCFEPLPDVYDKLKYNLRNKSNTHFYNYAIGASMGEMDMYSNEYSPSSSLLEMTDLHKSNFDFAIKSETTKIQLRTLDGLFKNPVVGPILLKVDVQGYELSVLAGGDNVLKLCQAVIIETCFHRLYKDQPLFEDIYDYLTSRGFRYVGNIEQYESPDDNQILFADAVFIRK